MSITPAPVLLINPEHSTSNTPPTVLIFNINEVIHQYADCLYEEGIDVELLFNEMVKLVRFKSKCPEIFILLAQGTIEHNAPITPGREPAVTAAIAAIGEAIWHKFIAHGVYGSEYMGQYYVHQLTFRNDLVLMRDVTHRDPGINAAFDVGMREPDKTDDETDNDLVPF